MFHSARKTGRLTTGSSGDGNAPSFSALKRTPGARQNQADVQSVAAGHAATASTCTQGRERKDSPRTGTQTGKQGQEGTQRPRQTAAAEGGGRRERRLEATARASGKSSHPSVVSSRRLAWATPGRAPAHTRGARPPGRPGGRRRDRGPPAARAGRTRRRSIARALPAAAAPRPPASLRRTAAALGDGSIFFSFFFATNLPRELVLNKCFPSS